MGKLKNIIGNKYGRLTVTGYSHTNSNRKTYWACVCECGNKITAMSSNLQNGNTRSCGCLKIELANATMIDLVGLKFGRLTVIKFNGKEGDRYSWKCICDCGNEVIVGSGDLKTGHTQSCGCYRSEFIKKQKTTHGQNTRLLTTAEYMAWQRMLQRCNNPNDKSYQNYGGRGIKVCDRWFKFENFYADMGDRPKGMSLDRYPNNETGNYEPSNCRWATRAQQARGKRSNVNLTYDNRTQCLTDWANEIGMQDATLRRRIKNNWNIEQAFKTPLQKHDTRPKSIDQANFAPNKY